jgi:hypothetical protein
MNEAEETRINESLPGLLPSLDDKPEQCEVCEKTGVPFIRVEVGDDEGSHQWLSVCSDDCLHQVTSHWKQIAEVIYPGEHQPKPRSDG